MSKVANQIGLATATATAIGTLATGCSDNAQAEHKPAAAPPLQTQTLPQGFRLATNAFQFNATFYNGPENAKIIGQNIRNELATKGDYALDARQAKMLVELATETHVVARHEVSERVALVQLLLHKAGYLSTKGIDGVYGQGMERALTKFQMEKAGKSNMGEAAGWRSVGALLMAKPVTFNHPDIAKAFAEVKPFIAKSLLVSGEDTVRQIDKEIVARVQEGLNKLGYPCGPADGILGGATGQAMMNFFKDNGMNFYRGTDGEGMVAGQAASGHIGSIKLRVFTQALFLKSLESGTGAPPVK